MSTLTTVLLAFGFALLVALAAQGIRLTLRNRRQSAGVVPLDGHVAAAGSEGAVLQMPQLLASAIHFGVDVANPAVTLRALSPTNGKAVENVPVVQTSIGVASRVLALMQAAPSLLVAEAHRGSQLMEVVVNGSLARASDGDGFRAVTMGPGGIKEHARLFETKDLSKLVNAAAVWQLASVIVCWR